jgi:hypothetical protein
VTLHVEHDVKGLRGNNLHEHAVSDWTGMLGCSSTNPTDMQNCSSDVTVRVDGYSVIEGTPRKDIAKGNDRNGLSLFIYQDGNYEFKPNGYGELKLVEYSKNWSMKRPLPIGDVLSGTANVSRDEGDFHYSDDLAWTFTPAVEKPKQPLAALPREKPKQPLEALPSVAPTVVRGETLTLDGSQSTGDIKSYRWTFKPVSGSTGPPPRSDAVKQGDVARVILLDSVDVILTVSDGQKTDSKTVHVKVEPRQNFWTEVTHHKLDEVGLWQEAPAPEYYPTTKTSNLRKATFRNACEFDSSNMLDHVFHPYPGSGAPPMDYFTLVPLDDPGGPFDGYYYFKEWKAKIHRKTMISKWLVANGPSLGLPISNWYQANGDKAAAFLKYADTVAHWQTDSIFKELHNADTDPAQWAESRYGTDSSKLSDDAIFKIMDAEKRLRLWLQSPKSLQGITVSVYDYSTSSWVPVKVAL